MTPAAAPRTSSHTGLLLWVCALCAAASLIWVAGPLFDGDLLVARPARQRDPPTRSVRGTGLGWSVVPPVDGTWTTTQWLSEVLMAKTQAVGGWAGLGWLRLIGEIALLSTTAWAVLRKRSLQAATAPFCLGRPRKCDLRPGPAPAGHLHPVSGRRLGCRPIPRPGGRSPTRRRARRRPPVGSAACGLGDRARRPGGAHPRLRAGRRRRRHLHQPGETCALALPRNDRRRLASRLQDRPGCWPGPVSVQRRKERSTSGSPPATATSHPSFSRCSSRWPWSRGPSGSRGRDAASSSSWPRCSPSA